MTPTNGFLILALPFNADGVSSRDVIDIFNFRKYIAATICWYKFVNVVGDCFAINGAGLGIIAIRGRGYLNFHHHSSPRYRNVNR